MGMPDHMINDQIGIYRCDWYYDKLSSDPMAYDLSVAILPQEFSRTPIYAISDKDHMCSSYDHIHHMTMIAKHSEIWSSYDQIITSCYNMAHNSYDHMDQTWQTTNQRQCEPTTYGIYTPESEMLTWFILVLGWLFAFGLAGTRRYREKQEHGNTIQSQKYRRRTKRWYGGQKGRQAVRPRVRLHTWTKDGTCEGTGRSRLSVASSAWAQARTLPEAAEDTYSKPRRNGTQRLQHRSKAITNLARKLTDRINSSVELLSGEDLVQFATQIEQTWQHATLTHGHDKHHTSKIRTKLEQTRLGK